MFTDYHDNSLTFLAFRDLWFFIIEILFLKPILIYCLLNIS